jgi:hypothetical protein
MTRPAAEEVQAMIDARMMADESPFADPSDHERERCAALLRLDLRRRSPPRSRVCCVSVLQRRGRSSRSPPKRMRQDRKNRRLSDEAGAPAALVRTERGPAGRREGQGVAAAADGGGAERRHVGAIRIHDRTRQVEIAADIADRFERKGRQAGQAERA